MAGRSVVRLLLSLLVQLGLAAAALCPGNTTVDEVLASIDMSGKVAVVTGGDSGLGYATATGLAKRGATVIIATHNRSKGERKAREIAAATGANVSSPWTLDLASLASVRAFCSSYLSTFGQRLNFLINNAGIMQPSVMGADGFELVFEVDYLGHFLLTELLLPALRGSSPARVVNVASGAHENACEMAGWPQDCFKDWTYLPPPVVPHKPVLVHFRSGPRVVNSSTYGVPKFLQTQHSAELAEREKGSGVEAFSITPGLALSGLVPSVPDPSAPQWKGICDEQAHPDPSLPTQACPFSSEQGAAVIAFCVAGRAKSGAYFSRSMACKQRQVVQHGMSATMRSALYSRSREWVGLEATAFV